MRDLFRWDPFREMEPGGWPLSHQTFSPDFEIKETPEAYVFRADVPGVKEEDLEISLTGSRLAVNGKREEEERKQGETYYSVERSYGVFSRSFLMPDGCDVEGARADLRNGVLMIHIPKKAETKAKKISVSGAKQAKA